MKRIFALLLVLLLLVPAVGFAAVSTEELEGQIHMEINRTRRGAGLEGLYYADSLSEAAERFARAQAAKDEMGHASREDLRALSSVSWSVGENVAFYSGPDDARMIAAQIVDAWVKSPSHYENMMRPDDTAMGIGAAYGASGRVYISLVTGKPFADAQTNAPSERTAEEGVPGLPYSAVPGDDPLAWRAVTGPGFIVYGRNRDLNGAVRVEVVPIPGKNYKNDIYIVDANGNRIHGEGTLRVYMRLPKNVARPVIVRVDGVETHFAEAPGTDYVWFPYEF